MRPAWRPIVSACLSVVLLGGIAALKAAPAPQATSAGSGAAAAPQQPPYSLAEYNAYKAANDEQDPQKKIALLDDFVSKYPMSALLPYVYRAYYLAYYQVKNYDQTLAYVDKLLSLGDKVDLGSRMEALVAWSSAYLSVVNNPSFQTPDKYKAAVDHAAQGAMTLAQWQKPANMTDDQFAQQKKSIGFLFDTVTGMADSGLKDYAGAQKAYQAALMIQPNDAVTHYRLGVADLQAMPPDQLNGMWELARAVDLKAPGADQVQAYLRNQVVHYQQLGCDKLADTEVSQLLTLAQAGNSRPAAFTLPSADDLKKTQDDTTDFMSWLMGGGDHATIMWLATCGLEYPDVPVRVMEVRPGEDDNLTLEVFRPSVADPDAASKEMEAATMANMEVHVVGQPDAKRIMKDDYVRFTGTLSGYQQSPFLLTWDNAKVNPEDIPTPGKPAAPKRAAPAARPAPKPAG